MSESDYLVKVERGKLTVCTPCANHSLHIATQGTTVLRARCAICGAHYYCVRLDADKIPMDKRKLAPPPPPEPPAWLRAWRKREEKLCDIDANDIRSAIEAGASWREAISGALTRAVTRAYEAGWDDARKCALCDQPGEGTLVSYNEAGEQEMAHAECVKELHEIDPEGRR